MREAVANNHAIQMHTGDEPVRLILEGFPEPRSANVLEKRQDEATGSILTTAGSC
jgi:hypothetical protein